jgi:carbon-monoxide dehydrogenase large subunit
MRRREDLRLLTGHGTFTDDRLLAGAAVGVVVRSPHAHAEIRSIDVEAARAAPGVLAVLTGADLEARGVGPIPCLFASTEGPIHPTPWHALARDRVRHVGDPVAFVVAESDARARDAAEAVRVDYRPLPAVLDLERAIAEADPIWPFAPRNIAHRMERGDRAATERAFAAAAHVVRARIVNQRIAACCLEPRAGSATWDRGSDSYTLHTVSQGVHGQREMLARKILGIPEHRLRVICGDVGGAFGVKNYVYPEMVLLLVAARVTGRPVRWVADRIESFLSDAQARDHIAQAELALDAQGRFLAIRCRTLANLGAYLSNFSVPVPASVAKVLSGPYRMQAMHYEVRCLYTNTVPVDAFRGAGQPEGVFVTETLIDRAARALGVDPIELRRRNLLGPEELPVVTAAGNKLDSGDFPRCLREALALAEHAGFAARRAASEAHGKKRGLGVACYHGVAGGEAYPDSAEIRVDGTGGALVLVGGQASGQGHETVTAQIVADLLGIDPAKVATVQGDTQQALLGGETGGSRFALVNGNAMVRAATRIVEKAKRIAAHRLEAAVEDIAFEDGRFRIVGTDRSLPLDEVASIAYDPIRLPPDEEAGLAATAWSRGAVPSYPNGCHVAEVEVDPETGRVSLERYTCINDYGTMINPLIVDGQVQGGAVQGIGQALTEECRYDPETGELLSATFLDYAIPRADEVPALRFAYAPTACTTNGLGVKGCGESCTAPAQPALVNAVADALGTSEVAMPLTPERVWRVCRGPA